MTIKLLSRQALKRRAGLVFFAMLLFVPLAVPSNEITIGHLQLKKDSRYSKKRTFARFLSHSFGRPYAGAKVAMKEVKFHAAAVDGVFNLDRIRGKNSEQLIAAMTTANDAGVHYFLLDAPGEVVAEVAAAAAGRELLLFNVSAREDQLRQSQCQRNLMHVIPNYAMLTDALVQYLVSRKWTRVFVLEGQRESDKQLTAALNRSVKRYGAKIIEQRTFVLSNDPRQRDQNNVALLTAGVDYDVLFVADTDGEFARDVPYQTVRPRLVVGAEGLAPAAWHWAWERHGAPQLIKRFEKDSDRHMGSVDWAAWLAVKIIAEAVQRTQSAEFATVEQYIRSPEAIFDGFKGNRSNFRPWDNQLRQPILLITHNWVVDRAPITGFLHQKENMDTLGFDEPDSECQI